MVDKKQEPWHDSEPIAVVPEKTFDYKYFNLITPFIVSLVISFVGCQLKLFRVSWYECMTLFQDHPQLVIKKYLFPFNYSFIGIDYKLNE